MAFQIFTDTSSSMPKKLREKYGIEYFRMGIIINGDQKHGDLDYEEYSREQLYEWKAVYSQTEGLAVTHMGGDVIGTLDTVVIVRLTNSFGDVGHMSWRVNPSDIVDRRGDAAKKIPWLTGNGSAGVVSFAAGDTAYVVPDKNKQNAGEYLQNGLKSENKYSFDNPSNVGKEFLLVFTDTSGTTFAKTRVIIAP